jgi:DNA-binding XRE family transcriptional regulator
MINLAHGGMIPPNVDSCKSTFGGLRFNPHSVNAGSMSEIENPYAEIGQRLAAVRVAFSDSTQREWAAKHGFNSTQYNNWEKGVRRITVESAEKLCDLYGLTLDFLYRGRRDGLSESARKRL